MGRKVCRPSSYSHGNMPEKLRNNFHDHGDVIRRRPTSWEERGNRAGSACQNPCVSLRIPVMPAWGRLCAGCPGGRLTQVMEGEARRGGEAVKEQMQQRRAG